MSDLRTSTLPIAVDCGGCGVCCMHMGYPAYLHDLETQPDETHWTNLPSELKEQLLRYIANYVTPAESELDGPCVWLDLNSRRCKHHEHRPKVCRDFEVGSQGCLEWREQHRNRIVGS